MANSRFGTVRLSTVSPSDVEIYYCYNSDRDTQPNLSINKLEPATQYLKPFYVDPTSKEVLGGMYNLTLPSNIFNQKGFYTILIRPKQVRTTILDCGAISSLPNEKGIVLSLNNATDNSGNIIDLSSYLDKLTGFRIEYLNNINGKQVLRENYFTIVTSANKSEAVSNNLSNVTQKSISYRLTDSGNLLFLTVSPNVITNVRPNLKPFIGEPGQSIILSNTNFNPIMIEVEFVNYNTDNIGSFLVGNQIRDVKNGEVTFYNDDLSINTQVLLYEIQDEFGNPLYEVKQKKTQVDTTQDFNEITGNLQ